MYCRGLRGTRRRDENLIVYWTHGLLVLHLHDMDGEILQEFVLGYILKINSSCSLTMSSPSNHSLFCKFRNYPIPSPHDEINFSVASSKISATQRTSASTLLFLNPEDINLP